MIPAPALIMALLIFLIYPNHTTTCAPARGRLIAGKQRGWFDSWVLHKGETSEWVPKIQNNRFRGLSDAFDNRLTLKPVWIEFFFQADWTVVGDLDFSLDVWWFHLLLLKRFRNFRWMKWWPSIRRFVSVVGWSSGSHLSITSRNTFNYYHSVWFCPRTTPH